MAVIIRSQDLNEITFSQFGGPYDTPWTNEPTPPVEFCPECEKQLAVDREWFGDDWEFRCTNPECEMYGVSQTSDMIWRG